MVGLFQSYTVALNGLHHLFYGFVLCHDACLQFVSHAAQPCAFALGHSLHGHAGCHCHHVGNSLFGHDVACLFAAFAPQFVLSLQFLLQFCLLVAATDGHLEVLLLHRHVLLLVHLFNLLLQLYDDIGHLGMLQVYTRAHLVHSVDGLVGECAVGDVAFCQFDTCRECLVGICHVVVLLVAFLYVVQYFKCLFCRSRLYEHFLEPALQRSVFLDGVAILVESRCADALYCASCQSRLHYVCSVHCSGSTASTYEGVYLVYKYNDVRVLLEFFQQSLDALLELSAILRASHHARHVEVHHALAEEHWRCLPLGNHLCQTFHYGALAHARFAYEYGVVLLSAAQYLHHALHFLCSAHHRVEFSVACSLCEVCGECVNDGSLAARLLCLCLTGCALLVAAVACRHNALVLVFLWEVDAVLCLALLLLEESQSVVICHVVHFQNTLHSVVCLVVQHSQQQVLLVNNLRVLHPCLEHGEFQNVACLLVEV